MPKQVDLNAAIEAVAEAARYRDKAFDLDGLAAVQREDEQREEQRIDLAAGARELAEERGIELDEERLEERLEKLLASPDRAGAMAMLVYEVLTDDDGVHLWVDRQAADQLDALRAALPAGGMPAAGAAGELVDALIERAAAAAGGDRDALRRGPTPDEIDWS